MKVLANILMTLGSVTLFASVVGASTVICHTPKNGGNFTILFGTLTAEGFSGTLSRGINQDRGAANAQFEVTANPVGEPSNMTISFDVPTKIEMPTPYNDIEWQKINLTFQKTLLVRGRGGLIERGILHSANGTASYETRYICVVRQL